MNGPILFPLINRLVACLSYLSRTSGGSVDTLSSCCVVIGGMPVPKLLNALGVGVVWVPLAKSTMSC